MRILWIGGDGERTLIVSFPTPEFPPKYDVMSSKTESQKMEE